MLVIAPPFKTDLTGKMFGKLYVRKYAGKGSDEHEGKRQTLADWADELGVDLKRLWNRLFRYKMPTALALNKILLTGGSKPCELTHVEADIDLSLGAKEPSKA